jgi:hypothetical protein
MEIKALVVNTGAYDNGDCDSGEWVSFPVTKEDMKEVYSRIGVDGTYFKEVFLDDFKTDVAGLINVLNVYTDIDELNYLALCLSELPSSELAKLDAIAETSPFKDIRSFINFASNVDYYVLVEGVKNPEDLGNYYLYKSGMVQMPEEWKSGIDPKAFGEHIQKDELGEFTKAGYLIDSGDGWLDNYCGKEEIHEDLLISPKTVFKLSEKEKPSVMKQLGKTKEQIGKLSNTTHKKSDIER